ncbi:hypothetical protein G4G27_03915 [Sphingomonas sp. So64.6b]|uniref:hypothetical protein n=1 Tax=Sphingomonas sp. So64.6b TaxID=2997354 RepID=UPI00160190A3|nr:hypothetical protein [Sphingomonas sp. So64.6b]QNA83246.1 hypothetical protein G4G27_03915 [Sphingomonas sp. So64.6b]
MTSTLIQIVPRRSISPEGVGDYARLIAEKLLRDHDIRTVFISGSPLPPDEQLHDEWETLELAERSAGALLETLDRVARGASVPILLHLSAYGYQRKGVPLWLVKGLECWHRENSALPLVTIFHELYATGPIWSSAFWVGPLQAWVARRIQRISTAGIATTGPYAALLDHWHGGQRGSAITLPVFSTIGDLEDTVPATERSASLAIFGRAGIYDAVYRERVAQIEAFVTANKIGEIVDMGGRTEQPPAMIGAARVRSIGQASIATLRKELGGARFGLLDYDADRLAKSTIFAAYCAHGAIPICLSEATGTNDGLRPGENYLKLGESDKIPVMDNTALGALQQAAKNWYQPHSLKGSADVIDRLLRQSSATTERV